MMKTRRVWAAGTVLWITAGLLAVAPLSAQGKKPKEDLTVRTVEGHVTGADDNSLPGAVVHLKDTKTLRIRSFITKEDGVYRFANLDVNIDYQLRAENHGEFSPWKTLSVFDTRRKPVINLKIESKPKEGETPK